MEILIANKTDESHLEKVMTAMQTLGAPTVKAAWDECYGMWVALEGSHRIVAAQRLGLMPIIDEIPAEDEEDRELEIASLGLDNDFGGTLGEFIDRAYQNPIVSFED